MRLIVVGINDPADAAAEGIDVLIRPQSARARGAHHRESPGIIVRKLMRSPIAICAAPEYLRRAGVPRSPSDLQQHSCLTLLTLERDVQDEWLFVRANEREKIKVFSRLTAHGEELREAALAGCGIVRLLACHVEDELRAGTLVRVLPAWECLAPLAVVAIYRKSRPMLPRINAFLNHLAREFRRYDVGRASSAGSP